jgi:hypothetical protein
VFIPNSEGAMKGDSTTMEISLEELFGGRRNASHFQSPTNPEVISKVGL